jgi:glycosyltransferase involved in cell wall biosynthesis
VRFLGQMPQAQILDWYRTGQIFSVVLPSLHEGIPVSLMEAMSCGVPVISSRVGGTPELLEAGAGLLVPPADPAALADAITSLLEDARLWARTARIGRDRVEREFAIERVVSQLEERFAAPGSDPPEHQRRSPQEQRASAVAHELEDASRSAA